MIILKHPYLLAPDILNTVFVIITVQAIQFWDLGWSNFVFFIFGGMSFMIYDAGARTRSYLIKLIREDEG